VYFGTCRAVFEKRVGRKPSGEGAIVHRAACAAPLPFADYYEMQLHQCPDFTALALDGTFRGWWIILLRSTRRQWFSNPWRSSSRPTASRTLHQRSSASISGPVLVFISGRKKPPKLPKLTNRQGPPSRYRFSHQRSLESEPLTPRCPTNGISRTHDEPNSAILKTTQYQTDP
jgi:hypothetical protein